MLHPNADSNIRPAADPELLEIAEYVANHRIESQEAYRTARLCLLDALGCALLALRVPECRRHLGPLVPGTVVPVGARVPGTSFVLDPVKAAFDIGTMVRWLDYNDTWLAAEWGHPSDNLGGILAVADWVSRGRAAGGGAPSLTVHDLLTALIKAYEIQGVLALGNAFNRLGLDHVLLVKVASTAVVSQLLGATSGQIVDALSQAWADGASLRAYRHAPNACSRKSWAAGDATSRAVRLALMTMSGEPGLPSPLRAPRWGFCDALLRGSPLARRRAYGSYVVENVLFKVSYPAEFHAQTAVESAVALHARVRDRIERIERIETIAFNTWSRWRSCTASSRPRATGTSSPGTLASMRCATGCGCRRTRASPPSTITRRSAPSATRCRSSSTTAPPPTRSPWSIPWATADAGQRPFRSSIASSGSRSRAASRRIARRESNHFARTRSGSQRRPSTNSPIGSCLEGLTSIRTSRGIPTPVR